MIRLSPRGFDCPAETTTDYASTTVRVGLVRHQRMEKYAVGPERFLQRGPQSAESIRANSTRTSARRRILLAHGTSPRASMLRNFTASNRARPLSRSGAVGARCATKQFY